MFLFFQNIFKKISEDNGIQVTNAQIYTKTIRAAQHLQEIGLNIGDVIGIVAKNSENLATIVFAAFSIGTPINTLDPNFAPG